jgi:hypothetical protein
MPYRPAEKPPKTDGCRGRRPSNFETAAMSQTVAR